MRGRGSAARGLWARDPGGRRVLIASAMALLLLAHGGCATRRKPARMTKVGALAGPHFGFARSGLTEQGRAKVYTTAATLNRYPRRRVLVIGYADSSGDQDKNLRLSQRRADAVMQALIEDGVSPARLSARGYGTANPAASNATAEGRAVNRRVEIYLE